MVKFCYIRGCASSSSFGLRDDDFKDMVQATN